MSGGRTANSSRVRQARFFSDSFIRICICTCRHQPVQASEPSIKSYRGQNLSTSTLTCFSLVEVSTRRPCNSTNACVRKPSFRALNSQQSLVQLMGNQSNQVYLFVHFRCHGCDGRAGVPQPRLRPILSPAPIDAAEVCKSFNGP